MLCYLQFLSPNIAFPAYPRFSLRIYSQDSIFQYPNNISDIGTVYITDRNNHISSQLLPLICYWRIL